jgi:quercetin dioxygenase-like cupin family protein
MNAQPLNRSTLRSAATEDGLTVEPLSRSTQDKIARAEAALIDLPQLDLPLTHRFAPGLYFREIFMPQGALVIGHEHKTEHFNVVLTGKAMVQIDGKVEIIAAPSVFVSKPGIRKVLYILEDMRWATLHPTDETDIAKLEDLLIIKSPVWQAAHDELHALVNFAANGQPTQLSTPQVATVQTPAPRTAAVPAAAPGQLSTPQPAIKL